MLGLAIDMADRQRMLSQRMTKAYAQLVLDINPETAQTILSESVKLFQNQLQTLQLYIPSVEVKTAVEREAAVWGRVKPIVTGPASEAGLRELVALADELLASAHQATIAYEARTNKTPGGLIKVLSRQRVLSQRIVSLYLAQRLGVQVNDRVELAGAEFHKALDEMYQSPQTNPSIKAELELAKVQWLFMLLALSGQPVAEEDQRRQLSHVATTSERLLQVMEQVTKMYEKVPL
jgi:hypothetical protein